MRWIKKIIRILVVFLFVASLVWAGIHYRSALKKIITPVASKIPFIKKYFASTPTPPVEGEQQPPKEEQKKEEAKPLEVKAFKVPQINFTDTMPIIGTIRGIKKVNLRFEINGTIASINFREGDLVEEGDIIAEIDHEDAQLKVKFREAKLEAAKTRTLANKSKLEQHQKLLEVGAIIKSKLDEVQYEYENADSEMKAAQIELDSAKLELEKTYLKSPISGVLESKDAEPGEFVTSSIQIASLGEIKDVFLEMGIIEKDVLKVALGNKVTLKVDTYPEEEFTGEVDNIFPTIEGKSRTLTVRAKFANPENKLLPGMFGRGTITIYEKENAVLAPIMGVDKTEEGSRVFVIDKDSVIHQKAIEIEYAGNTDYYVIGSGLEVDEIMVNEVVSGQFSQLKDGDKVIVLETEEYTM